MSALAWGEIAQARGQLSSRVVGGADPDSGRDAYSERELVADRVSVGELGLLDLVALVRSGSVDLNAAAFAWASQFQPPAAWWAWLDGKGPRPVGAASPSATALEREREHAACEC